MQKALKELYIYSRKTGIFRWRTGARAGKIAGCTYADGYHNIRFLGRSIGAHRAAWLYVRGFMPKQVDHKNGNPSDNRLSNLRASTQAQNRQNSRTRRDSKSGFKGVIYCADHKKWRAMIGPRGRVKHLGYFITAELAHKAYCIAAKRMYGRFARTA
jgi:hypothetical protein